MEGENSLRKVNRGFNPSKTTSLSKEQGATKMEKGIWYLNSVRLGGALGGTEGGDSVPLCGSQSQVHTSLPLFTIKGQTLDGATNVPFPLSSLVISSHSFVQSLLSLSLPLRSNCCSSFSSSKPLVSNNFPSGLIVACLISKGVASPLVKANQELKVTLQIGHHNTTLESFFLQKVVYLWSLDLLNWKISI